MVSAFEGKTRRAGEGTWVHPWADVFGDVRIGSRRWIGPGARFRGDQGRIVGGDCCAIEHNRVVDARPDETCAIGSRVTLGRGSVVHDALRVGDFAVIGMGAVVGDRAELAEWATVAEGAVVPQRAVDDDFKATRRGFEQLHVDHRERYRDAFGR